MTGYTEDTQERRQQAGRCQEDVSRYAETSLHISVQYFLHATSLALGFLSQHAFLIGSIPGTPCIWKNHDWIHREYTGKTALYFCEHVFYSNYANT